MKIGSFFTALAVAFTVLPTQDVEAAEIKVLSIPFKGPLDEIRPEFERTTGHKLLSGTRLPPNCAGRSPPARNSTWSSSSPARSTISSSRVKSLPERVLTSLGQDSAWL